MKVTVYTGAARITGEVAHKPVGQRQWWEIHTTRTERVPGKTGVVTAVTTRYLIKNWDYMEVMDDGEEDTAV